MASIVVVGRTVYLKTDLKTNGWRSVVSEALVANPSLTVTALAKMLGKGITVTKQYVATLKKEGAIRRVGPDKGGKWKVIGRDENINIEPGSTAL